MPQLLAGAGKANLTPYVGAFLAGFGGRDHGCEGIHDDLFARAVVLRAGETAVGLVACDLIGLGTDSVATIRQRVGAATGIPGGHIMVACSHTHSGPTVGILRHPGLDMELVHVTERKIAGALIAAHRSMVPASLGVGKGRARIGINRRQRRQDGSTVLGKNPEGPTDDEVGVLRINDAKGKPIALLVNYACHPVVLGGNNYFVSADYPGQMAAFLEAVYPGTLCAFINGTGGNINSVPVGGTFEDARRLGVLLGAEAVRVAEEVQATSDVTLAARQATAQAPLASLPPLEDMRLLAEARSRELDQKLAKHEIAQTLYEVDWVLGWARDVLAEYAKPQRKRSEPLELQALRLGDAVLISTPGETFVEIGLAIKAGSPVPNTFVLGYTNGVFGYIPTAQAFKEGGYEVDSAYKFYKSVYFFAPGVEEVVVKAGIELAKGMA